MWATLTERDSRIYEDNDLELFIAGQNAYYEFEINALNTIYEVFWIWKDTTLPGFDPARSRTMTLDGVGGHVHPRGERWGYLDWDYPGLRHAVHIDGVRGWTVELALPWRGLELLADGRSLPPRDGDVWRIDCSRFQQVDRAGQANPARRRLDLEPPRPLRLAHPGAVPLRHVLEQAGGGCVFFQRHTRKLTAARLAHQEHQLVRGRVIAQALRRGCSRCSCAPRR